MRLNQYPYDTNTVSAECIKLHRHVKVQSLSMRSSFCAGFEHHLCRQLYLALQVLSQVPLLKGSQIRDGSEVEVIPIAIHM